MSKLQLNNHQSETINSVKDKLESALADGVENPFGSPAVDSIVEAMEGYKVPISPEATLTDDDKNAIKGSYMSTFAAFLSALNGSPWTSVPYSAGWGAWGDQDIYDMQYKKNGLGVVSIRGIARKSAIVTVPPSLIAILPTGFRPSKVLIVAGVNNGSPCEFRIEPTGAIFATTGSFAASDGWWSLIVSYEAA